MRWHRRRGLLPEYLELCADIGFDGIECGAGFTDPGMTPAEVVRMPSKVGLAVEYEVGKKHGGEFDPESLAERLDEGRRWLDAGAHRLIDEARERATGVGLFAATGKLNVELAQRIVDAFGLERIVFEAPSKSSQCARLDHFVPTILLASVPLAGRLRVETYRRGLHSYAFAKANLRPAARTAPTAR